MASEEQSPEERIYLRQINVSQPRLEQASSQHSINAAEEYESARTSRPSSRASQDGLLHSSSNRFSTPPSSPPASPSRRPRPSISQDTDRTLQGQEESAAPTPTQSMPPRQSQIPRKPISSTITARLSEVTYDGNPPTPGVDDTPFIRFAIDQLTRDEEVRGSRQYPATNGGAAAADEGARQAPNTGLQAPAAFGSDRTEGVSSRETSGGYAPGKIYDTYQSSQDTPDRFETPPETRPIGEDAIAQQSIRAPQPALLPPGPGLFPPRLDSRHPAITSDTSSPHDIFVPYDQEVPPLRFRPGVLHLPWLGLYLFFCLWIIIGLLFSGIYPDSRDGLYTYTQFGGARYFIFRYMPTFFSIIMLLWLFQIQIALQRIAPFIALASYSTQSRSQAPLMPYLPSNFLAPKLFYFRAAQPLIGSVMLVFWLQIFTVPLFSSLYNVYYYGNPSEGEWRWTTVQGVSWTLFALFFMQFVALATLMVWIYRRRTGLKWDARSLADVIALMDRANIMADYAGSEAFTTPRQFQERLSDRSDRLGYWRTSRRPNETFHGVGEEGADTRRYSLEHGRIREKSPMAPHSSFTPDSPASGIGAWEADVDLESGEDYQRVRNQHLPWYMRFSVALGWCILGLLLYVAFLVVSFVNRAVIRGFSPLARVAPTAEGFSAANFTYSFIPAVIGQLLFVAWLSIDYAHRRLQPYVNMSAPDGRGANAARSLLLDYPARLPGSVTLDALVNKDFKVAWLSLVSLLAACLPILAGGCFWAQFYVAQQEVRVSVEPSGYYALCVFLGILAATLPAVLTGLRKRQLPHACTTLAEQTSWIYQSNVLSERDRRGLLGSKSELVVRMVGPKTQREQTVLTGGEGRFVFGKFTGRDGKTHLGIERFGQGEKMQAMREAYRERSDSARPGTSSRPQTPRGPTVPAPAAYQAQQRPSPRVVAASAEPQLLPAPAMGIPLREKLLGGFDDDEEEEGYDFARR